jgi:hypothetical protein
MKDDVRPPFFLSDVTGADFHRVKAERAPSGKTFILRDVADFNTSQVSLVPDMRIDRIQTKEY